MFKEATIYKIGSDWQPNAAVMEPLLLKFTPCGPTQEKSVGWVPPRGNEHGALVEAINGQHILKLMIETKSVPASALEKKVNEVCDHIEQTTGRKPGRKERKAIKEDALLSLLPAAFPKQSSVWVWIDGERRTVVVGTTAQAKLDEVVTALVRSFDSMALGLLQTATSAQQAMVNWLTSLLVREDLSGLHNITIGRACELRSDAEDKAVVKFANHDLENYDIRKHIVEGKMPKSLALNYSGRIDFVLRDAAQLKKIRLLEGALAGRDDRDDAFDADVLIFTEEFRQLLPDLIEALGSEIEQEAEEA